MTVVTESPSSLAIVLSDMIFSLSLLILFRHQQRSVGVRPRGLEDMRLVGGITNVIPALQTSAAGIEQTDQCPPASQ